MTEQDLISGFVDLAGSLMNTEPFRRMKQYEHHGQIDTHFHSVHVAFRVYRACVNKQMSKSETEEITTAALLHDLYLYNWYTDKHDEWHAFYHPKQAVKNIEKYELVKLTDMQREMILLHMFPLGKFPKSYGGFLLTLCDKYCAALELTGIIEDFKEVYDDINRRVYYA